MPKRCIALYSGGLDSILAAKLMQQQGVEVVALHFVSPFFGWELLNDPQTYAEREFKRYGIRPELVDYTADLAQILLEPAYGFGKRFNPCIDCKIGMLKKARTLLEHYAASFIVTGEVLGQRPMSQRRDTMNVIERDTDLKGLLLRPLCAHNMKETRPELDGLVERSLLKGFTGRGRREQIDLALSFGISEEDIPTPAGGCLLTDGYIAARAKQAFRKAAPATPDLADLRLATIGRHFKLSDDCLLAVSRSQQENEVMAGMLYPGNTFLRMQAVPGPLAILRGPHTEVELELAASICQRYTKRRGEEGLSAAFGTTPACSDGKVAATVMSEDAVRSFQIDLQL